MSEPQMTPRNRLQEALHYRDMSIRELAKRTKISKSHLSGYLSGDSDRMTFEMWIAIAQELHLDLNWLAGLPEKAECPLAIDEDELLRLWRRVQSPLIKETTFSTFRAAIALEELDQRVKEGAQPKAM